MQDILRIYLPLYLLMYILAVFVVPTYRIWKSTGINPITFGKEDTAHNYIGFAMKLLIGLLFIAVILFALGLEKWLSPILFLQNQILQMVGLIFIHLSLIWISIAQYQMSNSWRIGIDETNKTELKTKGLFSISRNPIFFGMLIALAGLFFIVPNVITFFCALATYFIIQIQIRLEEDFLLKQHGKDYTIYITKTRRFI